MKIIIRLLLLTLACAAGNAGADAIFGRLYTTPKQRTQLDETRIRQMQQTISIPVTEAAPPQLNNEQPETSGVLSITLDGIVYRSDGKNTAWVNRSSTNEGNLETQFTRVGERDVHSNHVRITLPGSQNNVQLKVGQSYDVTTEQTHDMAQDQESENRGRPASDSPAP